MKVNQSEKGNVITLVMGSPKDYRLLKAFLHLDHFINSYDDVSLDEVITMVAEDEMSIEDHIGELSHEIASDSSFDDGIVKDAD